MQAVDPVSGAATNTTGTKTRSHRSTLVRYGDQLRPPDLPVESPDWARTTQSEAVA